MSTLFAPQELMRIDPDEMPERTRYAALIRPKIDAIAQYMANAEPEHVKRPREVVYEIWRDLAAHACMYWPIEELSGLVERFSKMADEMEEGNG